MTSHSLLDGHKVDQPKLDYCCISALCRWQRTCMPFRIQIYSQCRKPRITVKLLVPFAAAADTHSMSFVGEKTPVDFVFPGPKYKKISWKSFRRRMAAGGHLVHLRIDDERIHFFESENGCVLNLDMCSGIFSFTTRPTALRVGSSSRWCLPVKNIITTGLDAHWPKRFTTSATATRCAIHRLADTRKGVYGFRWST